jgi:hypothetical protein
MRWEGHVACMVGMRNAYKVVVRKSEGRRPLIRPRNIWEDIITYLRKIRLEVVDWIGTSGGLL